MEEKIKELTLLLMYLTSFTERGYDVKKAWKGYDFDIMNNLDEQGFINSGRNRNKSVVITEDGEKYAEELIKKYGVEQ
ncbi:MAG TPA: transposase [Clostridiales bacterium]|nr:MAG: hypothetical protein A2Y22_07385 [Clostridiales bacterium GWD2_32_59]HAN09787.1 transposase [Clostridiales bacterium]